MIYTPESQVDKWKELVIKFKKTRVVMVDIRVACNRFSIEPSSAVLERTLTSFTKRHNAFTSLPSSAKLQKTVVLGKAHKRKI